MKKNLIETTVTPMLADIYTPVGIYLRLRDRFRDTLLLESTDHRASENSYSFICIQAIAGIECLNDQVIETKLPGLPPEKEKIVKGVSVGDRIQEFMNGFDCSSDHPAAKFAQGLYGYTSYDAIPFFESIHFNPNKQGEQIGQVRYRLYQYVIVMNHFKDELYLCENKVAGLPSRKAEIETLIRSTDVPVFPFELIGDETTNVTDEKYLQMVEAGIKAAQRGDVFQIVLSRRFQQKFKGDEFNVYRALRSVNPSPYLFFFDYGSYKLMGSSPEAQLQIKNGQAVVHPIAGTFRRTGQDEVDQAAAKRLLEDAKENAEHVMLVDLARNDLSRLCSNVEVTHYRELQFYSHVIHLVSEVSGKLNDLSKPFSLLGATFPAGTLSGAPKFKAMELIDELEPTKRCYYGGALGFVGFDGSFNHAILIRTFLSKNNTLTYQAGAGVVAASQPQLELEEVNHKLGALKKALQLAEQVGR